MIQTVPKFSFVFFYIIISLFSLNSYGEKFRKVISVAEKQTGVMLNAIKEGQSKANSVNQGTRNPSLVSPRSLTPSGDLILVPSRDWTSGFFPGVLWFLYEASGNKKWEMEARAFTSKIENEKMNAGTHDMGFKIYCSFGSGYRLTKDPVYKDIIIQSARTLSRRFNPVVGCIRSWDHNRDKWDFPVIIDNMMNLELLFAATRFTGDSSFYRIAVSHADNTMKNHYRPDFSSYHVVDYDTLTGQVIKKTTHQGFSNESAWSRGQAWGLYGFTMCYRETHNPKYLALAERIASFILNHPNLPSDLVPYWDFNAPGIPDEPRDASAASVMASALLELGKYSENGSEYVKTGRKILKSLTENYRAPSGTSKGFLLIHSTGSKPGNSEIDVPLIFGDYYFMEALLRAKKL